MVAVLSVPAAAGQGIGTLTALAVFAVVFTGIACSAIALPLQLWGQRRIPPARAALILLAEPVFAGIAGFVNGERLDALQVAGAAIILVGIAVSELGSASARDTAQSAESLDGEPRDRGEARWLSERREPGIPASSGCPRAARSEATRAEA